MDILELGVPFSDPLADGIVNQLAAQRALDAGATPRGVLECVRQIRRDSQIPIVLYTYINPLMALGFEAFHREAEAAGVDGLLILDLPPEEDAPELASVGGIRRIRLIAPTTPDDRIARITAHADGFIYYVSREGVTGEQTERCREYFGSCGRHSARHQPADGRWIRRIESRSGPPGRPYGGWGHRRQFHRQAHRPICRPARYARPRRRFRPPSRGRGEAGVILQKI